MSAFLPARPPKDDHEPRDASVRVIALTAAVLAFGVVAAFGISSAMYVARYSRNAPPRNLGERASFAYGPKIRTSIEESWSAQETAVSNHLRGYSWIDRKAGIVRIPVERAVDVLLTKQTLQLEPKQP